MAYRADDLVPLLSAGVASDSGDVGFRQGVMLAFNAGTNANTVSVGGATLTDLPILSTSAAAPDMAPGSVIGLLRWKSSWFILGTFLVP